MLLGQTCSRLSCYVNLTCSGVRCHCCESLNCTYQADRLDVVAKQSEEVTLNETGGTIIVENCTRYMLMTELMT